MIDTDNEDLHMYNITKRINNLLWQCHHKNDFTLIENIMRKLDPDKLTPCRIISVLSTCRWGEARTDSYPLLLDKCRESLEKRGVLEDGLLDGLEPKQG